MESFPISLVATDACCNPKDVPRRSTQIVDLPYEVHLLIIEHLEKPEIKMARLVCRTWCWMSSPYLLNRIYFAPRRGVMEVFKSISFHPIFAETVVELVFDSRLFLPQLPDREVYSRFFGESVTSPRSAKVVDAGEGTILEELYDPCGFDFEQSLGDYQRLLDEQMEILSASEDTTVLSAGLSRTKSISRVIVDDSFPKSMYGKPHSMDDDSYERRSALEAWGSMPPAGMKDAFLFLGDLVHNDFRIHDSTALQHLFGALSHCNVNIKELSMENMPAHTGFWGSKEIEHLALRVYPNLTKLDLSLCDEDYENVAENEAEHIDAIVGHHLSRLSVSDLNINSFLHIGQLRSSNLVKLDIGNCVLAEKVIEMLKYHKVTLRCLSLVDVCLDYDLPSTWSSIFSELGRTLRLNQIALKYLMEADDTEVSPAGLQGLLQSVMHWVGRENLALETKDGFSCASLKSLTNTSNS